METLNTNKEIFAKFKERWPVMFSDVVCGFHLPERWVPFVWSLCGELEHLKIPVRVDQVKSKFGGLRFYFHIHNDDEFDHDEYRKLENIADSLVRMTENAVYILEQNAAKDTRTGSLKV